MLSLLLSVAATSASCKTLLDCCGSPCVSGKCTADCNAGYKGPSCCALDLGECSVAVHPDEVWSWGAAPRWTGNGSQVEVYAMGLRQRCGINNCECCQPDAAARAAARAAC